MLSCSHSYIHDTPCSWLELWTTYLRRATEIYARRSPASSTTRTLQPISSPIIVLDDDEGDYAGIMSCHVTSCSCCIMSDLELVCELSCCFSCVVSCHRHVLDSEARDFALAIKLSLQNCPSEEHRDPSGASDALYAELVQRDEIDEKDEKHGQHHPIIPRKKQP